MTTNSTTRAVARRNRGIVLGLLAFAGGVSGLGALLDALVNSVQVFTPRVGIAAAGVLVAAWAGVEVFLSVIGTRIQTSTGAVVKVKGLRLTRWAMAGALALIGFGALVNWRTSLPQVEAPLTQAAGQPQGRQDIPMAPSSAERPESLPTSPSPSPTTIGRTTGASPVEGLSVSKCHDGTPVSVSMRTLEDKRRGAKATFPELRNPCAQQALSQVNAETKSAVRRAMNDYAHAFDFGERLRIEAGAPPPTIGEDGFFCKITCGVRIATQDVASLLCLLVRYANDMQNHWFQDAFALNFELYANGSRSIRLEDLIVDGAYAWADLERLVRAELVRQGTPPEEPDDRAMHDELEAGFGITPTGLAFRFRHYSTGPYIDGAKDVAIPFKELRGILRSDSAVYRLVSTW